MKIQKILDMLSSGDEEMRVLGMRLAANEGHVFIRDHLISYYSIERGWPNPKRVYVKDGILMFSWDRHCYWCFLYQAKSGRKLEGCQIITL